MQGEDDSLPLTIDTNGTPISVEALQEAVQSAGSDSAVRDGSLRGGFQTAMPIATPPMPVHTSSAAASPRSSRTQRSPRRSSNTAAPVVAHVTPQRSTASEWSAAAWSAGAPPSVHSSPAPRPLRSAASAPRVEPPPRPRSSAPQAWEGGGPLSPYSDARVLAPSCSAASMMQSSHSAVATTATSGRGRPAEAAGSGSGMAPPKETARERRLQQQRDALSHAVGISQQAVQEAGVRLELLRNELMGAEDSTTRAAALVAGGAAERAALRSQLDALGAELRIARQANERSRPPTEPDRPRQAPRTNP